MTGFAGSKPLLLLAFALPVNGGLWRRVPSLKGNSLADSLATGSEMRGRVLLNVSASAAGGARQQRVLPLAWAASERQTIHASILAIHADFSDGVPPDLAIETHARNPSAETSPLGTTVSEAINWSQLIQAFKDHKLSSGAIKQSTWDEIYWRRMAVILDAVGGKRRPISSKQLLQAVIESWKDKSGSRGRQ
jgi:hypothetical protein